jgi:AraC-like DNA-binding protein
MEYKMKTLNTYSIHLSSSETLPLYRSTRSLEAIARYLSMLGIYRDSFLAGSGIEASDLDDPDVLVTPEQEFLVLQNIVRMRPDPGLGLYIGRQFHMGILGKLGAAAINSDTFLDALKIIFQYSDLLQTYFHYDLMVKNDLVFIKLKELVDLKDTRLFMCEREFASIQRIASDLIGAPFPVSEIWFAYPKPEYVSLYQDIFQCPLVFNAESHMAIFEKKYFFQQLPLANPLARKTYEKECRQLSLRIKRQGTIAGRVHQEILFHKDSIPSFDQLAHYMNISPRTLRRRLTAEGTSYRDLASKIRKNKAITLLQTTDYPIEQIATELGYSDLANFYRAFKQWTDRTPGSYRVKNTQ